MSGYSAERLAVMLSRFMFRCRIGLADGVPILIVMSTGSRLTLGTTFFDLVITL